LEVHYCYQRANTPYTRTKCSTRLGMPFQSLLRIALHQGREQIFLH
jgi:hypothetical protein